uniref:Uncharacterized protein n=1 Tax=Timema douglasi TaxID=61478 RepID=A0A7R8ZFP7_TIMDO|nr:unnamed protein product [Timema douglasi]
MARLSPIAQVGLHHLNHSIPLEEHWQDDEELVSKYLDSKDRNRMYIRSYLVRNPAVHELLHDYVTSCLHLGTHDVDKFTSDYFSILRRGKLVVKPEHDKTRYAYVRMETGTVQAATCTRETSGEWGLPKCDVARLHDLDCC